MTIDNMQFGEDQTCSSEFRRRDIFTANRQPPHTHTQRHAHHNTPLLYRGWSKYMNAWINTLSDKKTTGIPQYSCINFFIFRLNTHGPVCHYTVSPTAPPTQCAKNSDEK